MQDLHLQCLQCGQRFIFPVIEQQKYAAQGFDPPKRCPECRKHKTKFESAALSEQGRFNRLPGDDEAAASSARQSKRRQKERSQRQALMERNW